MSATDPKHDSTGYLYMAMGFVGLGLIAVLGMVTSRLGPASIPIWAISLGGVMMVIKSPIGQAIATRLGGTSPHQQQLDVPQEVYAELDELRARIGELEERTDFTERLIAKQGTPGTMQ